MIPAAGCALLCIDFVNDMVSPGGKISGKGYSTFVQSHQTLNAVARAQALFRLRSALIVHVRVGFSPGYPEHSTVSPLLGRAKEFGALQLGQWGTEFVSEVAPLEGELVVTKHRVSAFVGTNLDLILRARGVTDIYIAGVSTDLAVESAARSGHDLDYRIAILSDCCAAATDEDHERSMKSLAKLGAVIDLDTLE